VAVRLNGVDMALAAGRATLEATLQDGSNSFEIIAQDVVGNVGLRQISVILDAVPPVIREAKVSRPDGPEGAIMIEATATDNVGLRTAARYRIAVDGVASPGVLRCDGQSGRCTTTLPPQGGTVTLTSVIVEDYAGNRAEKTAN
jgi:hypothetical protein